MKRYITVQLKDVRVYGTKDHVPARQPKEEPRQHFVFVFGIRMPFKLETVMV
jgi:hypothetical protein